MRIKRAVQQCEISRVAHGTHAHHTKDLLLCSPTRTSAINSFSNLNLESKENVSINAVKITCEFCGRIGHTESVCYKKHGVSTSYEGRSKTYNRNGKTCTHCGKIGHTIDVCYKKHGYPPGYKFGNSKIVNNIVEGKVTSDQMQRQESHDLVRFSPEQYQALLALIQ